MNPNEKPTPLVGDMWVFEGERFRVSSTEGGRFRLVSLDLPGNRCMVGADSFRGGRLTERGGKRVPE